MLNYFSYDYAQPDGRDTPFAVTTELAVTPWNPDTRLVQIGIKGYEVAVEEIPAANLVFLVDVSGSMRQPNKIGLLKSGLKMLARQLAQMVGRLISNLHKLFLKENIYVLYNRTN